MKSKNKMNKINNIQITNKIKKNTYIIKIFNTKIKIINKINKINKKNIINQKNTMNNINKFHNINKKNNITKIKNFKETII
jgi:hypothetical protein